MQNAPGASGAACDYPLIRYPDILLLYAEMAMRVTGSPTEDAMEKIIWFIVVLMVMIL